MKGIIGMHRFNICLVVVLSLSCSGVKTPLIRVKISWEAFAVFRIRLGLPQISHIFSVSLMFIKFSSMFRAASKSSSLTLVYYIVGILLMSAPHD